jgi:hypothetical protein
MNKGDILCAVDFSDSSIDALRWAVELARRTGSKLTIMFCYRLITGIHNEGTIDLKKSMEHEAWSKFNEVEKLVLMGQPFQYAFITEVGFYHLRIEMFLRTHPVRVLVVGNSIVRNFDEDTHLGFGQFLRLSKIPVVIVPHETVEEIQM